MRDAIENQDPLALTDGTALSDLVAETARWKVVQEHGPAPEGPSKSTGQLRDTGLGGRENDFAADRLPINPGGNVRRDPVDGTHLKGKWLHRKEPQQVSSTLVCGIQDVRVVKKQTRRP